MSRDSLFYIWGSRFSAVKRVQTSLLTDVENSAHFIIYWQTVHDSSRKSMSEVHVHLDPRR